MKHARGHSLLKSWNLTLRKLAGCIDRPHIARLRNGEQGSREDHRKQVGEHRCSRRVSAKVSSAQIRVERVFRAQHSFAHPHEIQEYPPPHAASVEAEGQGWGSRLGMMAEVLAISPPG